MNEMYDMSIVTHNWGVMSVLGVIFINIFMLFGIKNLAKYTRAVSLFTPIVGTTIGIVIFTGVVMMAAKHLDFTAQNIVMIIFAIILIYLEVKRSLGLKRLNKKEENAFKNYKSYALKIFILEILVILSISLWMWL
ncbi:MAG: hypothetical protein A3E21_03455 [Sulfurimonas sp. RIFCSPHIGHO2_12_FULL_36_9]|nr:MAG: hypothetical protein A3E21_03455 [Sulfurimonas sp. RIFCSPHIGHO2_12_FULL_36_9]OHD97356.1 MAG: hypothetical protein A3J26_01950 [Sulfurimonas sp. RIFCSPLOWO2_02_FULL_36_28]OHE07583.1 MAG: hypothetical protein A3K14_10480 [Sulfurimonas sp. RIFCSPLOWO2_12_FULL_36_74]